MSYYISPRFLDKLAIHITKNYLEIPSVKVPLILGIHGRKGEGKSFQCELAFERMGINVVYMSAGELESPDAGDPGRLVRLRYREAAELVKVRGKMAVLLINDIDAGAGRVDQYTQYTVNTQNVNGTLMNIADNPSNVQLPGSYELEPNRRVPIIVTGNDFSTLYAPLIRDGRMDKFFWEPDRADRIGIVNGIFEADGVQRGAVETLVDTFPNQSIDFYGAVRSRLYDEQVKALIDEVGLDRISQRVVNSDQAAPIFRKPNFNLPHLLEVGQQLVAEQKRVQEMGLAEQYNKALYFNRKLGNTGEQASAKEEAPAANAPYYHKYDSGNAAGSGNGQSNPQPASSSYAGQHSSTRLTPDVVTQVNQILKQGHRLGIEYVDERRFRANSWNSYGSFQGQASEAIAALEACLDENPKSYVRLVGIDPANRSRVTETIIQRPSGKVATA
ncbi:ribulose bisphosphate carboxylase small subunit [Stenomitos frigidus]|uniref:Ribulose 1,5-bisphosphate carboxylase n=1 Tax=Stenomitos frigidus ULC18 TaxID=2107698 RepID=A0A2T1EPK9_9CYAN|nr:ribulose bisphosphate carboxylase small subunit [Stenomitos frigidus]PSB34679.1 ribulose 1,5-bisphosphate carboxylase [Stenomitos frigidus ULC18]